MNNDFAKMLSQIDPKTLSEGIKTVSRVLSPEQAETLQSMVSGKSRDELMSMVKNVTPQTISDELAKNPDLAKKLGGFMK